MLNPQELQQVASELTRLYRLQGRQFDEDTKLCFLSEIKSWRYPVAQVVQAVKNLTYVPLKSVDIRDVRRACSEIVTEENEQNSDCLYCGGSGMVSLIKQATGSSYAFGCSCAAGDKPKNKIVPRWNGQYEMRHGKDTFRYWYDKHFEPEFSREAM